MATLAALHSCLEALTVPLQTARLLAPAPRPRALAAAEEIVLSSCCLLACQLDLTNMGQVVVAARTGTALTAIFPLGEALAVELQAADFGAAASIFLLVLFQRRGSVRLRLFGIEHGRIVLGRRGRVVEKYVEEVFRES